MTRLPPLTICLSCPGGDRRLCILPSYLGRRAGPGNWCTARDLTANPLSKSPRRSGSSEQSSIQPPIVRISSVPMPRVVSAGVPTRMPDGSIGLRSSNGIIFLLTVMPHRSSVASAILPPMPSGVTSTRTRWLSVPPLTSASRQPASASASALRVVDDLLGRTS